MKQRLGFVTNSSSSSFIAKIKKYDESKDYYDETNEAINHVESLMNYGGDPFGASIDIISNEEELQNVLNREDYDDIKWLLEDYIEDKEYRSHNREAEIIEDIKKDLKDYSYVLIDANRSCTSGAFKDILRDYIENNKIGEVIHYYCD